jgi:hypothetical protein
MFLGDERGINLSAAILSATHNLVLYYLRFNKSFKIALISAHNGHSNSDSFHLLRFRSAAHVDRVSSLASSFDSSGSSSSSIKLSSMSDSSASSSYSFFVSASSSWSTCKAFTGCSISNQKLICSHLTASACCCGAFVLRLRSERRGVVLDVCGMGCRAVVGNSNTPKFASDSSAVSC